MKKMFTTKMEGFVALFVLSLSVLTSVCSSSSSSRVGFSAALIDVTSPLSPHYDPNITTLYLIQSEISLILHRYSEISMPDFIDYSFTAPLEVRGIIYYMAVHVGSSKEQKLLDFDTGSSYVWMKCYPCSDCTGNKNNLFNPEDSETYRSMSCSNPICSGDNQLFCGNEGNCYFSRRYLDGRKVSGSYGSDTFHITKGIIDFYYEMPVVFGCANEYTGGLASSDGNVGMGFGPLSFISQSLADKFSYCVPLESTSTSLIRFGSIAKLEGPRTPLVPHEQYYQLALEGISLGSNRLHFPVGPLVMKLDSGATSNWLQYELYMTLVNAIDDVVKLQRVSHAKEKRLYCYDGRLEYIKDVTLTFHFRDGVDVKVPKTGIFWQPDEDLVCLYVFNGGEHSLLGMVSQKDYNVGIDLSAKEVSLVPMDCLSLIDP